MYLRRIWAVMVGIILLYAITMTQLITIDKVKLSNMKFLIWLCLFSLVATFWVEIWAWIKSKNPEFYWGLGFAFGMSADRREFILVVPFFAIHWKLPVLFHKKDKYGRAV